MSRFLIITSLLLFAGPAEQPAASPARDDDIQIRINGPITIAHDDTASTVWVVNHDATIDGVVRQNLGVVNGTARITGRVEGGVFVVNGRLDLQPGARIGRDVMLYRSTITRANDAIIAGVVHEETGFSVGAGAAWLVWLSFTIVVVVAGILFAEIAPVTLTDSARTLATQSGRAALTALVVMAAIPAMAIVSFATVIGIPLGLVLLIVVIPALSFLGYLVAASVVGSIIAGRFAYAGELTNRRSTIALGAVGLQLLVAVPVIGGLLGFIASGLGVGALVTRALAGRAGSVPTPVPAPAGA